MFILKLLLLLNLTIGVLIIPTKGYAVHWELDQYTKAPNPSFENGTLLPDSWSPINGTSCNDSNVAPHANTVWENGIAQNGNRSIAIKNIDWPGQPNGSVGDFKPIPGSWISSEIPIENPSIQHYVRVRAKLDPASQNLSTITWACIIYKNNYVSYNASFPSFILKDNLWWGGGYLQLPKSSEISKIKIGFSAVCYSRGPCSGGLWLDSVIFKPISDRLTIHAFEDSDSNNNQDSNEQNLAQWKVNVFDRSGCIGSASAQWTDSQGSTTFTGFSVGDRSASVTPENNWINTNDYCQDFTLQAGDNKIISFGFIQHPSFPYFSQKDPAWGGQEYDSAYLQGPYFCGTTMAGCGCAVTSSAMLLKFHGVDIDPNGNPTNPQTLNNWLKANRGYAFGALKWNSVAAYSVKANSVFGTQKIQFNGVGTANNFLLLDQDLNSDKPAILEEPGHFIVATNKQNSTYNINDPFFENKKTLADYSNSFRSIRRFAKTNTDLSAIYIQSPDPTDIFLTNSLGQKVGRDPATGIIYTEIPNSYYFTETDLADPASLSTTTTEGINTLIILTPQPDNYNIQATNSNNPLKIEFSTYDLQGNIGTYQIDEPETSNSAENFILNYSAENGSATDVTKIIDIDIKPESELNEINLKSDGIIPIAVLSSENFNALNINVPSINLNGAKESHNKLHSADVNGILLLDIILHFRIQDISLSNSTTSLCLEAQTIGGEKLRGCDFITLKPG